MKENILKNLRVFGVLIVLAMSFSTGCAGLNSGSENYQEAVDAPTEPEDIDEGYEEGAEFPEEYN
jgi:hypothetical protein